MTSNQSDEVEKVRAFIAARSKRIRGYVHLYLTAFERGYSLGIYQAMKDDQNGRGVSYRMVQAELAAMEREQILESELVSPGPHTFKGGMLRRYYRFRRGDAQ
jgi:hypothetical protein